MKVFTRLLIVGVAVLAIWCLFDAAYVKSWLPQSSFFLSKPVGWLLFALMPAAFFLSLLLPDDAAGAQHLGRTFLLTVIATVVWGFIAYTLLVNFHLAIGGKL
jgi:hypothetical protein